MKTATKVAQSVLFGSGALLLLLGLIIWTGRGDGLIPVHVLLGLVLVLSLWTLSAIAARSSVSVLSVALGVSCGVIVLVLGTYQDEVLTKDWHWTIEVAHLAISMGAIAWGRRLVFLMRQKETSLLSSSGLAQPAAASLYKG